MGLSAESRAKEQKEMRDTEETAQKREKHKHTDWTINGKVVVGGTTFGWEIVGPQGRRMNGFKRKVFCGRQHSRLQSNGTQGRARNQQRLVELQRKGT